MTTFVKITTYLHQCIQRATYIQQFRMHELQHIVALRCNAIITPRRLVRHGQWLGDEFHSTLMKYCQLNWYKCLAQPRASISLRGNHECEKRHSLLMPMDYIDECHRVLFWHTYATYYCPTCSAPKSCHYLPPGSLHAKGQPNIWYGVWFLGFIWARGKWFRFERRQVVFLWRARFRTQEPR